MFNLADDEDGKTGHSECRHTRIARRRRHWYERLFWAAVYVCPECRHEVAIAHFGHTPLLSFHACCPKCGSVDLKCLQKRDPIEGLYANPLSRMQKWLGAPLLYCFACRLQFFDLRPRVRSTKDRK